MFLFAFPFVKVRNDVSFLFEVPTRTISEEAGGVLPLVRTRFSEFTKVNCA